MFHSTLLTLLLLYTALSELIIVKTGGTLGPPPCAVTCVGTTGVYNTKWRGAEGSLTTEVDMSKCGFVSKPVVTISLEGNGSGAESSMSGSSAVSMVTEKGFYVWLTGYVQTTRFVYPDEEKPRPSDAVNRGWTINWWAAGFVC